MFQSQYTPQQQAIMERLNSLSLTTPAYVQNDHYTAIEVAMSKLSESDKKDILNDSEYQELVALLNNKIQSELFRIIRSRLNEDSECVTIMDRIARRIETYKNENDTKKEMILNNFEDYIKNHSDISYTEYLKLKNGQTRS